jgi:NADH-quinone oxidoreductase subunit C
MKQITDLLTKFLGDSVEFKEGLRGDAIILLKDSSKILETLNLLKENGFTMLIDLTAVHFPKRELKFDLIYNLLSMDTNERVILKLQFKEDYPEVNSVSSIYKSANWFEREVYDMFGIVFKNHPNLKRILMWEGYEGHPLRKEFPLEGDNLHCYD